MRDLNDTIVGVATPRGGIRGVIRLSGPALPSCLEACFVPDIEDELRSATRASRLSGRLHLSGAFCAGPDCCDFLKSGDSSCSLPAELLLWPTTRSYTRQPSAELHTLGSPPLLAAAAQALVEAGGRLAEPGEFTWRAFCAGRLDLTQVEAVLGVVDARDAKELGVALRQMAGGLSVPLQDLRRRLIQLLAELEAGLDFAEEDLELLTTAKLNAELQAAHRALDSVADRLDQRGGDRTLPRAVLVGPPNAGKSSLFNALAGGRALVSAQSGTTRDYLTAELDLGGIRLLLVDTAGLDSPAVDGPAAAAQRLAEDEQREADIVIVCTASDTGTAPAETAPQTLQVVTKGDLEPTVASEAIVTSAETGQGLPALRDALRRRTVELDGQTAVAATALRCRDALKRARNCLDRAAAATDTGEEFVAFELRDALHELGRIAGEVVTDDILDEIFSRFCIGK